MMLGYFFGMTIALAGNLDSPESVPVDDVENFTCSHGPEKPPPDDGYDFKGGGSGNGLGKLGLVMVIASAATGISSLRTESGTELQTRRQYLTGGLFVGGVVLLAIERAR
jgi:hypothetical protein